MNKSKQQSHVPMKTCNICTKSTQAEGAALIYFGEWMSKKEITVHYYCLILSTNLSQRGEDHGGILGFLLRDIRLEITKAKSRICIYCLEVGASLQCCACQKYFHLTCGHTSKCLSQFADEFKSYCHNCIPTDPFQMELFSRKPPQTNQLCLICAQIMGPNPKGWIYAKCCGNGFTHSKCMKIYALSAGYYLTCIWCKNPKFREHIKYLGVFVPDRDANWEKEKGAYDGLYRRHKRCDMEVCNCPKGRDYSNSFKWQLIICKLCGAFGAHNPSCVPGFEGTKEKLQEFKCDICSVTEQTAFSKTILGSSQKFINTSLYVEKNKKRETDSQITLDIFGSTEFYLPKETTENGNCISPSSSIKNNATSNNTPENRNIIKEMCTLTQSPSNSQEISISESFSKKHCRAESSDSDDSIIVNLLVQKVLDTFEVSKSKTTEDGSVLNELISDDKNVNVNIANNLPSTNEHEFLQTQSSAQTPILSQYIAAPETCLHEIGQKENSDSDDSIIADLLVQKVLDVFEAT